MVFSIIMLVCLIVCVGIDYLSLKRIERNGALLGVTLPQNAAELPEVQDIVQRYLRRLRTICLLCAAVSVGLFFAPNSLFYVTVWVYFFFGSLALPYLLSVGNRALQKLRDAHGWPAAPEDAAWKYGLLYYDPDDKRISVPKRIGKGSAVNLATLRGKIAMAVNVIAIVSILLVGPVLGVLDHTPARLELQVSPTVELQSYHGKTQKYTIPIDDITEVQVYSSLPEAGRIHGLDLEHYWQGSFVMVHDGTVHLCLDPTAGKFLRVETEDAFSGSPARRTKRLRKSPNGLLKRWGRLPIDTAFLLPACLRGAFVLPLPPENASKLQKMLQISHQKGRFAIDSLVIIGV